MHAWQSFVGAHQQGYRKRRRAAAGNAFAFLFGGFAIAYLLSEFTMQRFMHPLHWGTAAFIALLIYVVAFVGLLRRSYTQGITPRKK